MSCPALRSLIAAVLIGATCLGLSACAQPMAPAAPLSPKHPALSAPPLRGY